MVAGEGVRGFEEGGGCFEGEEKRDYFAKMVCKKPEAGYFKRLINQG